jgi:hypothetical protein
MLCPPLFSGLVRSAINVLVVAGVVRAATRLRLHTPLEISPLLLFFPLTHHVSLFISFLRSLSYSQIIRTSVTSTRATTISALYSHESTWCAIRLLRCLPTREEVQAQVATSPQLSQTPPSSQKSMTRNKGMQTIHEQNTDTL